MKIHHVGYLVKNIEKSINLFEVMGYTVEQKTVYDDFRGIDICFMVNGSYRIELVSPKIQNSIVTKLIKKIGNSPYHICYEVENMEKAMKFLRENRFVVWQAPHEALAVNGNNVVFMINSCIGIIELIAK